MKKQTLILSRRSMVAGSAALAVGCGDNSSAPLDSGMDLSTADAAVDGATPNDMALLPADAAMDGSADMGLALAIGGTAGFMGTYEDPFEAPAACALTGPQTLGPCYANVGLVRSDVSEGRAGWPTRLAFRVLDAGCSPVEGVEVEIWHTNLEGNYSGVPGRACSPSDPDGPSATYMRGTQQSDGAGRVDFDTIFPGWYPGRTPHVHVQLRRGGTALLTTQIYFRDEIAAFAYANHPEYNDRPVQDTNNRQDGIAQDAGVGAFTATDRMVDGPSGAALQCWFDFVLE